MVRFSAAVEAVTGLVLIVDPSLVARFLFGVELSIGGLAVGRVAGFALFALGLACWPQSNGGHRASAAVRGLLAYNSLAAIFFIYLGACRDLTGPLLWPAAALHTVLAALLGRVFIMNRD